ncbi:PREDICTED: gasdermin-C [Myotis davidii]|uniref:gasdermin-C n=1 Tax=Myotis davidii TaxID=225400 RepID=UPI0007672C75|nr:PREDICTED: gasdermin-C [Myotis davidii]
MPSMFERTTKKLVKAIGDQEFRPVKCLLSATKIRRFSLIQRKKARSRFWELPDVPLDVSLMHILEPGSSVPDAAVKVSADFSDTEVMKQQVAGKVNAGAEAGFSEETAVSRGSSLEYQIVSTPHETWDKLQERELPDPELDFLRQCREAGVNLYVVTDTVELRNSPVLPDLSSKKLSGKLSLHVSIFVKGEGQAEDIKVREKQLTVPKGSVLAYKRKKLVFYRRGWSKQRLKEAVGHGGLLLLGREMRRGDHHQATLASLPVQREAAFPSCPGHTYHHYPASSYLGILHITGDDDGDDDDDDDEDDNTFSAATSNNVMELYGRYLATTSNNVMELYGRYLAIGPFPLPKLIWKPQWANFQLLQEEVSQKINAAELSRDMQGVVFSNLLAMLGDREALQNLMDKSGLEREWGWPPRAPKWLHVLLAQSMEKRILLPQRDLVRSILEPNLNCFEITPFTLQPELLAPLQGEDLAITYGLLKERGLKIKLNSPRSTWDPEAKESMSALYGALSVLKQLAEA